MSDLLRNDVGGRWVEGAGRGTTLHGRVHVVSPAVAETHTGHGNVMPQSVHGGPGRAGGGEELGGLRALRAYHARAAVQAEASVLDRLGAVSLQR
ncbi:MAG: hypothetical protein JOZ69_25875 [Myxococcales bacterium]|nr:hypothetical protein [Myxococcales bacterium]